MVRSVFQSQKLLGVALAISFLTTACGGDGPQASAPQAMPVKLETLETANLVDSSQFVGILRAKQRVALAPRIEGRILDIYVDSGTPVTQGTPIILLQPTREQEEVNSSISEVDARQADLRAALSELSAAEAERARSAAEVEQARSDLQDAESELELAKVNFDRAKFLVEEGAQATQELDDKTRDLNSNTARRNARNEALNATIKSLEAAEARVIQAQANVDGSRANVATAQANVGVVSQDLDFNTVVAPVDGIVGDFPIKVGDFVSVGQELTTLTNNQTIELLIHVPVERRGDLQLGLPVEIINSSGSTGEAGKLTFISPTVDQTNQTILTKVTFENPGGVLKDQQFVTVRVIWEEQPGVLVPTTATTQIGAQRFVFVAEPGEGNKLVVNQKPIKVGAIQGQSYQVISGLTAGEQIAVSRILNLSNGTPIVEETEQSRQQTN